MTKAAAVPPSPCLAICIYGGRGHRRNHCAGCSMTRAQKRLFNGLKARTQREEFIEMVRDQQARLGGYSEWEAGYRAKCALLAARV